MNYIPFIKKFKTDCNYYIYDVNTNEILKVDDIIYNIIPESEQDAHTCKEKISTSIKSKDIERAISEIEEFKKKGYFSENRPLIKMFYNNKNEKELINQLNSNVQQLTLNATEDCNLRCRYCVYSGTYYHERRHSNRKMPFKIAKKAIDQYLDNSKNAKYHAITFYGGEPLLNFSLIKKCVDYIESKKAKKEISFGMTTNGTMLTANIIKYLIKKNFNLIISLDGPQHVHDRYRITKEKKGTFQLIMSNLYKINEINSNYFKRRISINAVQAPPNDLFTIQAFFNSNPLVKHMNIRYCLADSHDTSFYDKFDSYCLKKQYDEEYDYMLKEYIHKLISGFPRGKIVEAICSKIFLGIYQRLKFKLSNMVIPQGQCIPGLRKTFVSVNGEYHMCEKVGESISIGNVEKGYDFKNIIEFLNYYASFFENRCYGCWCIRLCSKCFARIRRGKEVDESRLNSLCENMKESIITNLKNYCIILEKNDKAFNYLNEHVLL